MTELVTKDYTISATQRFVDAEGRLTQKGFEVMKAVARLLQAVNVVDGEITTEKLAELAVTAEKLGDEAVVVGKMAAGSIWVNTLFVNEVVWTDAVKQNAISEVTALTQVGSAGPVNEVLVAGTVPIDSTNNTGMILTFTAFMDRPDSDPGNFGYWGLLLKRNGVTIQSTPNLYYDDNFSYQPVASFIDEDPGEDPYYEVVTFLISGNADFTITGGVLNVGLLKR